MFNLRVYLFFIAALLVPAIFAVAEEDDPPPAPTPIRWYRSNASGMPVELIPSPIAALRNKYSLSVVSALPAQLPKILLPYFEDQFRIELRILYEEGSEIQRQWIFRDRGNIARIVAAGSGGLFGGEETEESQKAGFIEIQDDSGAIISERRFEDDLSEWEFRFFYAGAILLKAETWFKGAPFLSPVEPPDVPEEETGETTEGEIAEERFIEVIPVLTIAYTDHYRYSRSGAIRAIERIFHEGADPIRVTFPRLAPDSPPDGTLGRLAITHIPDFIYEEFDLEGIQIIYTLDNRGRIISELWKDEEGNILGEYRNVWSDDRLLSVVWSSDTEERRTEYDYDDAGNRIEERNFRQDVLERRVTSNDGRETEEIFMNGRLILRAFWEGGLKISEERIVPAGRDQ